MGVMHAQVTTDLPYRPAGAGHASSSDIRLPGSRTERFNLRSVGSTILTKVEKPLLPGARLWRLIVGQSEYGGCLGAADECSTRLPDCPLLCTTLACHRVGLRSMNRILAAIAVVVVTSTLSLTTTGYAHPLVALKLPAQASAGSPTAFQWSASQVPPRARVELQAQVGTGRVWKRLMRLSGSSGTATLPPHSLGKYPIRIAVVGRHKHLLASHNATLDVFGEVPLGTLLNTEAQTYTTSNFSFSYVARAQADKYAREATALTISAAHNHCRSVHLEFPSVTLMAQPLR